MRRFYKKGDSVFELAQDGSQDHVLTDEYIKMTDDEIDRHLFPEKYMTGAEKRERYLKSLVPLTRRQFKLILLKYDLLDKVSEGLVKIEDKTLRMQAQIEFEDSTMFERLNPTLLLLYKAMGISESKLDSMWEEGLKL